MLIKNLCIPKINLTTVPGDATLQEAINLLEESGYRCVPVLDKKGEKFLGNIYKMHIYKHAANGGSLSDPVMSLIKNASKHICVNASFFEVFFTIKELPYITVLNEQGHFYGILTHGKLLGLLQDGWNVKTTSYVLTIATGEVKGALTKITKIIDRYSSIASLITLDNQSEDFIRRVLVSLPTGVTEDKKNEIVAHLERKGLRVVETEKIQK
ncbi:cyclic di-AMP binding protein CbpA [Listeria ivanovii]|uniref:cyclic di-AMP binding protein CbpA n=1 Tax=Listeria ivanovii TaxID=1638 RepID=UPI0005127311|nr:cyclic di-AMP binding protein CbpA [Listeria ivanovii]AIS61744.1 CBS protein [Listeria ivanovii subsp. londoniensis]MBK1965812.1 CBS domain-containing protein [Listeria ivanovii subsp. londoniensis]MBK1984841.1 CBS domain-containing protein [Listeria ivanovii subsp. londoniensis]MBK1995554.1 CBS domain-containing protein [Listeria ivanovii subsp. londoniensis]